MNALTKDDLLGILECIESLQKQLPNLSLKVKIDVAARLNAAAKTIDKIDSAVKDEIKSKLAHKNGVVTGENFKASLGVFPFTRLDQKKLEVEHPRVYAQCLVTKEQERVTFEVR